MQLAARAMPKRRIFASALARSLARDRAVDLGELSGRGPGGRIVASDVEEYWRTMIESRRQAPVGTETAPSSALHMIITRAQFQH